MVVAGVRDAVERLRAGQGVAPGTPPSAIALPAIMVRADQPKRRRTLVKAAMPPPRHAEPAAVEPAAPRLMRRAEVAPAPEPPFVVEMRPPQQTVLRGVVRWYDQRARRGSLRLPGLGEEVQIDADALERAGISRLYKGQEIEAMIVEDDGGVRLVSLALPGRAEPRLGGHGKIGSARRHAKPVVVEMKRDAMRRAAARIEAEQVLGSGRRPD